MRTNDDKDLKEDVMMTIKVGIIGCGGIANGKHMPSLQKVENVEMIAFCDVRHFESSVCGRSIRY